jgi:hypothetical protein
MSSAASQNTEARLEELLLAWEEVYDQGQNLPAEELCADNPELVPALQQRINALLRMEKKFGATGAMESEQTAMPEPSKPELQGRVALQSSYSILRQHAAGGLGEVYLAHDSTLQREVAVKTLKAICQKFPDRKGRFLREAQLTGQLEHPGIVPVYGLGTTSDGTPLYAMRFIRGESLEDELREYHNRGCKMSDLRRLLRHLVSACRTVHYAHSRRVLHCDIKPMNIMMGKFGETFMLDWGEAVVVNPHTLATEGPVPAASSIEENTDSPAGGTVPYMPPERVDGSATMLDATSDVYSMGATLYKLLTGRDAFRANSRQQLIDKIRRGDFPPPREVTSKVSRTLQHITLKAMARDREDRYQSAGALADDIQAWMDDEPIAIRKEGPIEWMGRILRRHRTAAFSLAAGLVAIVLATSLLAVGSLKTAQDRQASLQQVEKARESGLAALALVASSQIQEDINDKFQALKVASEIPDLPGWILAISGETVVEQVAPTPAPSCDEEPVADALSDAVDSTPTLDRAAASRKLQGFLQQLDGDLRDTLKASSWFVLSANGDQVGRFPEGELDLEHFRNFAYKSYFHGGEEEFEEGTSHAPLREPTISTVFFSSSDEVRKVAYSVPIWSSTSGRRGASEVVGVLVMTVEIGDFRILDIDIDQQTHRQAILVDARKDWQNRCGTLLQHPDFNERRVSENADVPLVDNTLCDTLVRLHEDQPGSQRSPLIDRTYYDPILKQTRLGAVALVDVGGRSTGWFVIVTEPVLADLSDAVNEESPQAAE